jgi:hypothetical protein
MEEKKRKKDLRGFKEWGRARAEALWLENKQEIGSRKDGWDSGR